MKLLRFLSDNFTYFAVGFLLLFIPLYPKLPSIFVGDYYVAIRLEDLLIAGIVVLFTLRCLLKKDFTAFKNPIAKLIGLYLFVGLLSLLSALFITKNINQLVAILHFIRRIEYMSLFFLAYSAIAKTKDLKPYAILLFIAIVAVALYALGQKFFGWPVVSTMNKEFARGMLLQLSWWARVNSTFAGHYDLAAFMAMALNLIAAATLIVTKKRHLALAMFAWLIAYYILMLTASRISFPGYLVGVLMIFLLSKRYLLLIPILTLSIFGIVFSDDLGQRYAATFKIDLSFMSGKVFFADRSTSMLPQSIVIPTVTPTPIHLVIVPVKPGTHIVPTVTPTPTALPATPSGEFKDYANEGVSLATTRSTDIRLKVEWPRAVNAFLKNPLLGTGYSSITLATDNDYLRALGETGLLGFLALVAIFLEVARQVITFLKTKAANDPLRLLVLGYLGMCIAFFSNAGFIDVLEASKVAFFFWLFTGLAVKIVDLNKVNR